MAIKIEIKNVFLFVLLTRIIQKELSAIIGSVTKIKLQAHIDKNNLECSAETMHDFLGRIDVVKLVVSGPTKKSTGTLAQLFSLIKSKHIGNNWEEFVTIQKNEVQYDTQMNLLMTDCDKKLSLIEKAFQNEEPHTKNLNVLAGSRDKQISDDEKAELKELYDEVLKFVPKRLEQIFVKEKLLGDYMLSNDEVMFLRFASDFPLRIPNIITYVLDDIFNTKPDYFNVLPPSVAVNRLVDKKILSQDENSGKVYISEPDIKKLIFTKKKELIPFYESLGDGLKNLQNSLAKCLSIICYQKIEKWDEVEQLLKFKQNYKKAGIFTEYSTALEGIVNSKHFISQSITADILWNYWHLAYCYNNLGELSKASQTLNALFKLIKNHYFIDRELKPEAIHLLVKSFQLSLEVLINYNDVEILKSEVNGITFFFIQFFGNSKNTEKIWTNVRCQLGGIIAKYFFLINDIPYSDKIAKKLFDNFIEQESSVVSFINLIRIDVANVHTPLSIMEVWANTAKYFFKRRKNLYGAAKANLYLAYIKSLLGEEELTILHVTNFLEINALKGGYDKDYEKFLLQIKQTVKDKSVRLLIQNEINRLNDIANKIELNKVSYVKLSVLINFNNLTIESIDKLAELESQAKGFLSTFVTPIHDKPNDLKSDEVQAILNLPLDKKMRYLYRAVVLSSKNYVKFYSNRTNMALLTTRVDGKGPEEILESFFSHSLVLEIAKIEHINNKFNYVSYLLDNNALNRAKILLDSVSSVCPYPEYYNLYGRYLLELNTSPKTDKKDYFNDVIIEYYRSAVKANEINLLHKNIKSKREFLIKNKARYLNNWGWAVIILKAQHRYLEARDIFIESINLTFYKDFPYPYHGILIIETLLKQPSHSNLLPFMDTLLASHKVNKKDRTGIIKTVTTSFSDYLNS